jgi:RNA polymerase sigma-70 factor (ECF subfamily)
MDANNRRQASVKTLEGIFLRAAKVQRRGLLKKSQRLLSMGSHAVRSEIRCRRFQNKNGRPAPTAIAFSPTMGCNLACTGCYARDYPTDHELIEKIAAKDHDAFKTLVDRHQALVVDTCYGLLGNREDAEDVAQEVFFRVYRSASKFRQEAKVSTWLYRIAVNRSLNFIRDSRWSRRLKNLGALLGDEAKQVTNIPAPDSSRPDIALEEKERNEKLHKAIDSLPQKQRAAFVLHKYEGLPYQEIAEIMHRSLSSVESLIHRAKVNLQRELIHYLKEK